MEWRSKDSDFNQSRRTAFGNEVVEAEEKEEEELGLRFCVMALEATAATTTATVAAAVSHSWKDAYRGMSSDNVKGLVLALSSSVFIGASFIVKKKGLKKAGASGIRAGNAPSFTSFVFILCSYTSITFDV